MDSLCMNILFTMLQSFADACNYFLAETLFFFNALSFFSFDTVHSIVTVVVTVVVTVLSIVIVVVAFTTTTYLHIVMSENVS